MQNDLILVVEDEPEIAHILTSYLQREGFRTITAIDGNLALQHHLMLKPDLVLLDVQLLGRDGFEVLFAIRKRGTTPVIMLTARAEDLDKLVALRAGADDYVVKPFNPMEVVARVKAVLRRTQNTDDPLIIRFEELEIDISSYSAFVTRERGRIAVDLTLTEYRLLAYLARAPRRVFSRDEIIEACLPESDALARTVDSHVSNLRRKLDSAGMVGVCRVVRGVGYRLSAQ